MTINFADARQWLEQGKSFSFMGNKFALDGIKMRVAKVFFPSIQENTVKELAKIAHENTDFATKLISVHGKKYSPILVELDRQIHSDHKYQVAENIDDFTRWSRWGFGKEFFSKHYDFVRFLLDTPLGSQMKLFNSDDFVHDGRMVSIVENEPAILVEGTLTKFSDLKKRFKVGQFRGENVIITTTKPVQVYTYLENGQGLQPHHPYVSNTPTAVARLTENAFQRTMESAQKFYPNPVDTKEYPHILQIVSSEIDGMNTNLTNLLTKPKHPWIRVILGHDVEHLKRGDIIDVGFGWTKQSVLPGMTSKGRFRCMDLWNYKSAKKRVVTNIPIERETAVKLRALVQEHQANAIQLGQELGFNLFRHNCTSFLNAVGCIVPNSNFETRIELKELIAKVSPDWLRKIGSIMMTGANTVINATSKLPRFITFPLEKIRDVFLRVLDFILAIPINLFAYLTGGALGKEAPTFEKGRVVGPQVLRTSLNKFYYYLPGMLQLWQRKKDSTVYFEKPGTLAVAPPVS